MNGRKRIRRHLERLRQRRDRGFSLILATTVVSIVLALGISLLDYVVIERKAAKHYENQINTVQIADAGLQKALFCLNSQSPIGCGGTNGDSYVGEQDVKVGGGTFDVTVTGSGNVRTITSIGTEPSGRSTELRLKAAKSYPLNIDTEFDSAIIVTDKITVGNQAIVNGGQLRSATDVICGAGAEINHDLIVSKVGGLIDNCDVAGDARADRIVRSDVLGDCYYNNGWSSSSCGGDLLSGAPTPNHDSLPSFDESYWHAQAEAGGIITGDYLAPDASTLGPAKIEGDLVLSQNVDITLLGPVWVTGNVELQNNATITLDVSFGDDSSVIMANGLIDLVNNANVTGTGEVGSSILLYSSSTTNPAIEVRNSSGSGVYLAPNGGIRVWNGAKAVSIGGKYVQLDENSVISYVPYGLSPYLPFVADTAEPPSNWLPVPGTWREL